MKKLMMFALLGCTLTISAAPENEEKIVSTFYGSKASSNANNPCKGATIRVCGKIETEIIAISESLTMLVSETKDAEGETISVDSKLVDENAETAKLKQMAQYSSYNNSEVHVGNE